MNTYLIVALIALSTLTAGFLLAVINMATAAKSLVRGETGPTLFGKTAVRHLLSIAIMGLSSLALLIDGVAYLIHRLG